MVDRSVLDDFGQLFIMAFDGVQPSPDTLEYLRMFGIGGLILFEDNYENPQQLRNLTAQLQSECTTRHPPLFICSDHEGGRVQRFRAGFTRLPAMAQVGRGSPRDTERLHRIAARELRQVGVNLNLAPLADQCAAEQRGTIGDRSFGNDPATVADHVVAAVRGLQDAGVLACVKHFPGHGSTDQDAHREVPCVTASLDRLEHHDLVPFRAAIAAGCGAVMTGHVTYPSTESGAIPASLSPFWVTTTLRQRLGFAGLIISDALEMKGIMTRYDPVESGRQALAAGTDILLYYKEEDQYASFYALRQALRGGELDPGPIANSLQRVRQAKSRWLTFSAPLPAD